MIMTKETKPKKQPKIKTIGNVRDAKREIEFLKNKGLDFTLITSNYTTEIICNEVPFFNTKYLAKTQDIKSFVAFNKIKKDLKTWSANEMPEIEKSNCHFFNYNKHHKPIKSNYIYNIDLSSAYAIILFNDCFISKETLDYMLKLKKSSRLACVGMLAAQKDIFTFENGKVVLHEKKISETEGYFYYCVNRTYDIMEEICKRIGNDSIFTWVDSVYYHDDENQVNKFIIENYLNSENLKFKFQQLAYPKIEDFDNYKKILP